MYLSINTSNDSQKKKKKARRRFATGMSKFGIRKHRRLRFLDHVDTLDGYSALCFATLYKHIDVARLLLKAGANANLEILGGSVPVDPKSPYASCTWPLQIAISGGCTELVNILLEHGAGYVSIDCNGSTPLHQAAQYGKVEVVSLLLDKCKGAAEVDTPTSNDDRTPLHIATQYSNANIVRLLLEKGAACDSRDVFGITPLQLALKNTDFEVVKLLLENGAADGIERVDNNGATLLHKAAEHHKHEVVKLLLERGVPHDTPDRQGYTPLVRALEVLDSNGAEVARLLLLKGAEYDIDKVPAGATFFLLHRVAGWREGGAKILQMLLGKNVDVNYTFQDRDRRTLLHHASQRGSGGVVRILLGQGLNLDCQSNNGKTPLHEAVESGEETIVQMLLGGNANPNIPDADGRTPLHVGLLGYERLILTRTRTNSAPNTIFDDNESIRHRHNAAALKFRGVIQLLVDKGANPDIADQFGNSARSFFASPTLNLPSEAHSEIIAAISQSVSGSSLSESQ